MVCVFSRASQVAAAAAALSIVGAQFAYSADLPGDKGAAFATVEGPQQHYGGFSVRGLYGYLDRDDSSFLKRLKKDGTLKVVDPEHIGFSNSDHFQGIEGEVFIGRKFGNRSLEFFIGGEMISSDTSSSGSFDYGNDNAGETHKDFLYLPAPDVKDGVTFTWFNTNQFDVNDYRYRNEYDRSAITLGIRPGLFLEDPQPSLKDWSLKDPPPARPPVRALVQPLLFVSAGRIDLDEHFSGYTDDDPGQKLIQGPGNVYFAYDNDIQSDFAGIGIGLTVRAPLTRPGQHPISFFATAKGTAEFHSADGTAAWHYDQIGPNNLHMVGCRGDSVGLNTCDDRLENNDPNLPFTSKNSLSEDETVYSVHLEAGLTFNLHPGVDLEVGGRYRYTEIPQVVIDGTNDAYIDFRGADEIGGFAGLKVSF